MQLFEKVDEYTEIDVGQCLMDQMFAQKAEEDFLSKVCELFSGFTMSIKIFRCFQGCICF